MFNCNKPEKKDNRVDPEHSKKMRNIVDNIENIH